MVLHFDLYYEYLLYKLSPVKYASGQLSTHSTSTSCQSFVSILRQLYEQDEQTRLAAGFHKRSPELGFQYFVDSVFGYYLEQSAPIDIAVDTNSPKDEDLDAFIATAKAWAITPMKFVIKKSLASGGLSNSSTSDSDGTGSKDTNTVDVQDSSDRKGFFMVTKAELKPFDVNDWDESHLVSSSNGLLADGPTLNKPSATKKVTAPDGLTGSQKRKRARLLRDTGLTESELLVARNTAGIQDRLVKKAEHMIESFFETPKNLDILKSLDYIGEDIISKKDKAEKKEIVLDPKQFQHLSDKQVKSLAAQLADKIWEELEKVDKKEDSQEKDNFYAELPLQYKELHSIVTAVEFSRIVSKNASTSESENITDIARSSGPSSEERNKIILTLIGEDETGSYVHPASPQSKGTPSSNGPPPALTGMRHRMKNRKMNGIVSNSKLALKQASAFPAAARNTPAGELSISSNEFKSLAARHSASQNKKKGSTLDEASSNDNFTPLLFLTFLQQLKEYNEVANEPLKAIWI